MEQDLALLQNISDTLKQEPGASQRTLAKNADVSIGLMNAILKRFVERGWIMLSNVNARKLGYALTPAGIAELAKRSRDFAKRTFALANEYYLTLNSLVLEAKNSGKSSVVLYGNSNIKFLLEFVCKQNECQFETLSISSLYRETSLCLIGELDDDFVSNNKNQEDFVSLLEVITN